LLAGSALSSRRLRGGVEHSRTAYDQRNMQHFAPGNDPASQYHSTANAEC
jgi:hypothetical protein